MTASNKYPDMTKVTTFIENMDSFIQEIKEKSRPHYANVVKDIQSIIELDLTADWEVYHQMLIAYLEYNNLFPTAELTQDVTCDYLNAKKVSDDKIHHILDNYTIYKDIN